MSEKKDYYVYIHYRKSDGIPFYVGKGRAGRVSNSSARNKWWKSIVDKHGFFYEKVYSDLSESEAFTLEKKVISELKDQGVALCNLTDGGEGLSGCKRSAEFVAKMIQLHTGRKRSAVTCQRISEKAKGRVVTEETRRKLSAAQKARKDNSGIHHHGADKNTYVFKNITTGEVFEGTRCDLANHIGTSPSNMSGLFRSKPRNHVKGWRLVNNGTETKTKTEVD